MTRAREVLAFIDRVEWSLPKFDEPVLIAPFVAWANERLARYASGEENATSRLLRELGMNDDAGSGARRLYAWRSGERIIAERRVVEDALDAAGVGWWEVYDDDDEEFDTTSRYCAECREDVATDRDGSCLWCGGATQTEVVLVMNHITRGKVTYIQSPEALRRRYERIAAANRQYPLAAIDRGWQLYEAGKSAAEVAQQIIDEGLITEAHRLIGKRWRQGRPIATRPLVLLVEEALRNQWRRRGYKLRSKQESLAGKLCRGDHICEGKKPDGAPCPQNARQREDGSWSRYCFAHDPETAGRRRATVVALHAGRDKRPSVDPAPFVDWLNTRVDHYRLPPEKRRYANRDEGVKRFAAACGVDPSQMTRWLRGQTGHDGKAPRTKTMLIATVTRVLAQEGSANFADIYGGAGGAERSRAA